MEFRFASNEMIYKEIGSRLKEYRVSMNLTQQQLAIRCGLSVRSIGQMERGESRSMDNFLEVLKALNIAESLDVLVPKQEFRPTEMINREKRKIRVRHKRVDAAETVDTAKTVRWGDE